MRLFLILVQRKNDIPQIESHYPLVFKDKHAAMMKSVVLTGDDELSVVEPCLQKRRKTGNRLRNELELH